VGGFEDGKDKRAVMSGDVGNITVIGRIQHSIFKSQREKGGKLNQKRKTVNRKNKGGKRRCLGGLDQVTGGMRLTRGIVCYYNKGGATTAARAANPVGSMVGEHQHRV